MARSLGHLRRLTKLKKIASLLCLGTIDPCNDWRKKHKATTAKCPKCAFEAPKNDIATQINHMKEVHPNSETVKKRIAEAEKLLGWAND